MSFLFELFAGLSKAAQRLQGAGVQGLNKFLRGEKIVKGWERRMGAKTSAEHPFLFRSEILGRKPEDSVDSAHASHDSSADQPLKAKRSFSFAGASGITNGVGYGVDGRNQLGATHRADLELAITRPAKIQRSESFKAHYRDWRRSQACQMTLQGMRRAYEQTFFNEVAHGCKATREELYQQVIFSPTPTNDSLRQYFLLDVSLEAAIAKGLVLVSSHSEKYVLPGQGLVVIQRYCLGGKLGLGGQMRGWWQGRSHGAVIQLTLPSERPAELQFRLSHDLARKMNVSMAGIMQSFFGELGPNTTPEQGPKGIQTRKSLA